MKEKQIIKRKFFCYLFSLLISIAFLFFVIFLFNKLKGDEILYFNSIKFAFVSSIIGFLFWIKFYKDLFENFAVFLSLLFICIFTSYIGPTTLDRSLSSFMFFYSVENGYISKDIKDEKYIDDYLKRRYSDAVKIGYFNCDDKNCYPTFKTKMTYYLFYPIGKLTSTLDNYYEFKSMADNFNKN